MTTKGSMTSRTVPPSDYLEQEYRDTDQQILDAVNAAKTVRVLVRHATNTVDLVTIADMLGLEGELEELVSSAQLKPERHRRFRRVVEELAAARADAIAAVTAAASAAKRNTERLSKARARAAEKEEQ